MRVRGLWYPWKPFDFISMPCYINFTNHLNILGGIDYLTGMKQCRYSRSYLFLFDSRIKRQFLFLICTSFWILNFHTQLQMKCAKLIKLIPTIFAKTVFNFVIYDQRIKLKITRGLALMGINEKENVIRRGWYNYRYCLFPHRVPDPIRSINLTVKPILNAVKCSHLSRLPVLQVIHRFHELFTSSNRIIHFDCSSLNLTEKHYLFPYLFWTITITITIFWIINILLTGLYARILTAFVHLQIY